MIEFRFNKIDVDIRRELSKEVKDRKVNRKGSPIIDNKIKKPFVKNNEDWSQKKKKEERIIIDGIYDNEDSITIDAEFMGQSLGGVIDSLK